MLYTPFIRAMLNTLTVDKQTVTIAPGSLEADALQKALEVMDGQTTAQINASNAIAAANAIAEKYRVALAWYADPSVYLTVDPATQIAADKGARARDVITEKGN